MNEACQQVLGGETRIKTQNEVPDPLFRHQWRTGLISGAADISAKSNDRYNLMMEGQKERPIPEWKAGYRERWIAFKEERNREESRGNQVEAGD